MDWYKLRILCIPAALNLINSSLMWVQFTVDIGSSSQSGHNRDIWVKVNFLDLIRTFSTLRHIFQYLLGFFLMGVFSQHVHPNRTVLVQFSVLSINRQGHLTWWVFFNVWLSTPYTGYSSKDIRQKQPMIHQWCFWKTSDTCVHFFLRLHLTEHICWQGFNSHCLPVLSKWVAQKGKICVDLSIVSKTAQSSESISCWPSMNGKVHIDTEMKHDSCLNGQCLKASQIK